MKRFFLLILILMMLSLSGCTAPFAASAGGTSAPPATAAAARTDAQTTVVTTEESTESAHAETTSEPQPTTTSETSPTTHATTNAPATNVPSTTTPTQSIAAPTTEPSGTTTSEATTHANKEESTRRNLIEQMRSNWNERTARTPKKDPAFFDDVVFVGDSVTMGLRNYATAQRNKGKACLGAAKFLCCGSMGYTNTLGKIEPGSMHPTYKGSKVTVPDGIAKCGKGKVFIMLGMNDFAGYGEKTWKNSVVSLLDAVAAENPNTAIYIQSVTPIVDGKEHGRFTNANIAAFNDYLRSVCSDRGYTYVDVNAQLADAAGHLRKEYCGDAGDMGIHMSNAGAAAWTAYLQETFCGA